MSVRYRSAAAVRVNITRRQAGDPAGPAVPLLHGFPALLFMYPHLVTALADRIHLVAPGYDHPCFE